MIISNMRSNEMELEEALLKRRSIRKYNADDISDEIINMLK